MTATLCTTQIANGVSVGPNGLVYVSLPNQILEVDPRTLQTTFDGAISVNGTPGPLVFTPDGQYGIGANQALFGNSLLIASLATHTSTDPALGLPQITSLQVTGVDTLLALSSQGLYQYHAFESCQLPSRYHTGAAPEPALALTATNDVPAGSSHARPGRVSGLGNQYLYQYNPATEIVVGRNIPLPRMSLPAL